MALPSKIDDYIKELIDHSLGLPVSAETMALKLRTSEDIQSRLRDECLCLESKLKEKDGQIELARGEATMNAQAIKKFVEENQKLAAECSNILAECNKWEKECSLYQTDREALMDFGNEAHERAKVAEDRAQYMEEEVQKLKDELQFYKHRFDCLEDGATMDIKVIEEEKSLVSIIEMLVGDDGFTSARSFLELHTENESCRALLKLWTCVKPATQKVLSLAGYSKMLEKDNDNLRINLENAEEEVKILAEENTRLRRLNRKITSSCVKSASTTSAKSNKRKSSPGMDSPVEKRLNLDGIDLGRDPLSPLECNSSETRMQKKKLSHYFKD